jgi:hypothetical protein
MLPDDLLKIVTAFSDERSVRAPGKTVFLRDSGEADGMACSLTPSFKQRFSGFLKREIAVVRKGRNANSSRSESRGLD